MRHDGSIRSAITAICAVGTRRRAPPIDDECYCTRAVVPSLGIAMFDELGIALVERGFDGLLDGG